MCIRDRAGAFLLCMFYSLQVECDADDVIVTYGLGLFVREIPIHGLASVGPVKNDRISTFFFYPTKDLAVEISLRDGKRFRILARKPKEFSEKLMARA